MNGLVEATGTRYDGERRSGFLALAATHLMFKNALLTLTLATALGLGLTASAKADVIVAPTFDPSNQAALPDTTDYEGNFYDFSSTFRSGPSSAISRSRSRKAAMITGRHHLRHLRKPDYNSNTAPSDYFIATDGETAIKVAGCDSAQPTAIPATSTDLLRGRSH